MLIISGCFLANLNKGVVPGTKHSLDRFRTQWGLKKLSNPALSRSLLSRLASNKRTDLCRTPHISARRRSYLPN